MLFDHILTELVLDMVPSCRISGVWPFREPVKMGYSDIRSIGILGSEISGSRICQILGYPEIDQFRVMEWSGMGLNRLCTEYPLLVYTGLGPLGYLGWVWKGLGCSRRGPKGVSEWGPRRVIMGGPKYEVSGTFTLPI